MISVLLRRLAIAIPILFVVVTLTFFLSNALPGDPGRAILGQYASQDQVTALDHQLGLDKPLLSQYGTWMAHVLRGDFGTSVVSGLPVTQQLNIAVPVTLSLTLLSTLVILILGVAAGTVSAIRGGRVDRAVQAATGTTMAIPNYWLGILLVTIFSIHLAIFPATGYVAAGVNPADWLHSLVLPVFAIGLAGVAAVARQTRGALIDTLSREYVRTLRACGTPQRLVILHALRDASIPVITSVGLQFIGVLGGAVIIEQVFALPGVGQLTLQAVDRHDIPVLQGVVVFIAVTVLIVNLIIDTLYALLNPKLRHA